MYVAHMYNVITSLPMRPLQLRLQLRMERRPLLQFEAKLRTYKAQNKIMRVKLYGTYSGLVPQKPRPLTAHASQVLQKHHEELYGPQALFCYVCFEEQLFLHHTKTKQGVFTEFF